MESLCLHILIDQRHGRHKWVIMSPYIDISKTQEAIYYEEIAQVHKIKMTLIVTLNPPIHLAYLAKSITVESELRIKSQTR